MAVPISPARCVSQHVGDAEGDEFEAIAKQNDRTSHKCNTFALRNNIDMSQLGGTHGHSLSDFIWKNVLAFLLQIVVPPISVDLLSYTFVADTS